MPGSPLEEQVKIEAAHLTISVSTSAAAPRSDSCGAFSTWNSSGTKVSLATRPMSIQCTNLQAGGGQGGC